MSGMPTPRRVLAAFVGLLVLLLASVLLARVHLGPWNPVVAVVIAVAKAAVVIMIFMRPAEGGPPARFALAFGIAWVGVLIALTLADVLTRELIPLAT